MNNKDDKLYLPPKITTVKGVVKAKKPSVAISQQRIADAAAMLLQLKSRREIVEALCTKYGIQPRSCDAIITFAYKYVQNNYPQDRESIVIKHLEFYYKIATEFRDIDPKSSLKALEQVEKLLRLHTEQPLIQQNTMNMNFDNISTDDLIAAVSTFKNK